MEVQWEVKYRVDGKEVTVNGTATHNNRIGAARLATGMTMDQIRLLEQRGWEFVSSKVK